uniref:Nodal modulator 1 n=1 Tax=Panagrolaimus sp. ES5 TaxID=591445 RepID=A0AC34EZP7_9BILA
MIPVYNKGQYKFEIKAPEGWIFEKNSIDVNVDGKDDQCSKGADINFKQTGFTISGKVKSGDLSGPRGFKLGLYTLDGKLQSESATDSNGVYSFKALPGSYVVYNVDQEAQCIERGKVSVTLKDAPVIVQPDITISGHLLNIKVNDESLNPLKGAKISLASNKKLQIENAFSKNELAVSQTNDGKYVYALETGPNGSVRFPCLPPGEYFVTPSLKSEGIEFSFEPSSKSFTMGSEKAEVSFKVAGFSTSGQVSIGNNPVTDAAVLFNGEKVAVTDKNGRFALKDVKSGSHRLSAEKKHFTFDVYNVKLSPSSPKLPTVQANKIEVCGALRVEQDLLSDAKVKLQSSSNQAYSVDINSEGGFCYSVTPGKYAVRVVGIPPVTPEVYNIDVTTEPRLNLLFTQFKANVEVDVACLNGCDGYKVVLQNAHGLISSLPASNKVKFTDIPPGSYYFTVQSPKPTCWEHDKVEFQIEDRDVSGLKLQQTGYKVEVDTDYPVELHWESVQNPSIKGVLNVDKTFNSFCVPNVGTYKINSKSCHVFDPVADIEVPNSERIRFVARKALANILTKLSSPTQEKFEIILRGGLVNEEILRPTAFTVQEQTFKFYIDMEQKGNILEFIPQSKVFLFKPFLQKINFDGNCILDPLVFDSEKGSFIEGSVNPAVEGVDVVGTNEKNSDEVVKVKTDKNGRFKFGPISKETKFSLTVEKEGYKFIEQKNNIFQSIKLSELRVNFVDSETKEPLGEVLASISGVDNYRSNKVIGETGTQNYIGLRPGEYYIIAVLQEYKFEHSPQKIVVKEGELVTTTLEGKRFAYSIFGKTTFLNKDPVSNIKIEALSPGCGNLLEDASSDENGNYRIRGLKLGCEYRIFPKLESKEHNSYPPFIKTLVKKEDRRGVDFVITSSKQSFELFGQLNFVEPETQPQTLRVKLVYKGAVVQKMNVVKPSNRFFFVNNTFANGEKFTVIVDDIKTKRIYQAIKEIEASSPFISTSIDISAKKKSSDVVISSNNYVGMVLFALALYAFMRPEKIGPIVDYLINGAHALKDAVMNQNNQYQGNGDQENGQRRRRARN